MTEAIQTCNETQQMFASRLKSLRKASGLSQADLAEKLGVSRGSISNYENCTRIPDIAFLCWASDFFGVDTSFFTRKEQKVKRLTFKGNFCDIAMCGEIPGNSFCEDGCCSYKKVWERLKKYEDAEEAGRIFVAPVAIGQPIWMLYHDSPKFYPETNGWFMDQGNITQVSTVGFQFRAVGDCDSDWIGYDEIGYGYYLTEAEVQAAFKAAVEHDC